MLKTIAILFLFLLTIGKKGMLFLSIGGIIAGISSTILHKRTNKTIYVYLPLVIYIILSLLLIIL